MIYTRTEKCIQICPNTSSSNVLSGFCRYVKIYSLLGCYTARNSDSVPSFGKDRSVRDHQSTLRNILKERRSQEGLTFALLLCLYSRNVVFIELWRPWALTPFKSPLVSCSTCPVTYFIITVGNLSTHFLGGNFFPSAALSSSYWLLKKDSLSWREWVLLIRSRRSFRHPVLI